MFVLNDDLSIYATRGDIVFFAVQAKEDNELYTFKAGDVVRIKIYGKKDANTVLLEKDFAVVEDTDSVQIFLDREDTKIGDVISKPKDYWYEVELNPNSKPQTLIGYDEDGAKVFRLFPEGKDLEADIITPEDIPVVDLELDMTSHRPVENQAIARAIVQLKSQADEATKTSKDAETALAEQKSRIDMLMALPVGATTNDARLEEICIGADDVIYPSPAEAVKGQYRKLSNDTKSSFFETGYASKYISACKVFTDEYEYIMISDIRRAYDGETGFRIYSCDETGKDFAYISHVALTTDFEKGFVEHHFGNNSLLKCYVDLTNMTYGGRQTGDGKPFVVKRENVFPMLDITLEGLKDTLFAACNTAPRKILTWVDDDTPMEGIASVKKICDNLGVKCSFATITQGWNESLLDVLHQYQKEGFHIACHTESHGRWYKDMPEGKMFNAQEMEADLLTSLEKMRSEGFIDCDMLVYAGSSTGRTDVDTIGIAKKWCRCGVLAGGATWSKYGQGKYKINRTFVSKSSYSTSYYKNLLNSVTDEGWVVLGTHSGSSADFDADMMTEILRYAIESGWKVMPLNEALKYREKYYHIQEMLGL
jgi:hypothetical protein